MLVTEHLDPGTVVGKDFEIVRLLGRGGMGSVYEARQISTGALRALKTMLPALARDEDFKRRFVQEAQLVARVESEHVVSVLSSGIDEALNVPYIAMELLRGEDLAARIAREGPPGLAITEEIFAQLGHALAAAHAAGIVHRDLKPENVFVCDAKSATRKLTVKVIDFGIAKALTAAQATTTQAIGTPLWMAPEQTTRGGAISPAADVWAFALMAFYALTGRHYWNAANDASGTPVLLLRELALEPLEPASIRARAHGGAPLPPGFDGWFGRCVSREPASRYQDASEATAPLLALLRDAAGKPGSSEDPRAAKLSLFSRTTPYVESAPSDAPPSPQGKTATALSSTQEPAVSPGRPGPPARGRAPLLVAAFVLVASGGWFASRALEGASSRSSGPASAASAPPREVSSAKMVRFEGGSFLMGADAGPEDEQPPTLVSFGGFAIDGHEVTTAAYIACQKAGRCSSAGDGEDCNGPDPSKLDHPINCVTFKQAKAYCEWQDRRLPSEAEWEFAARGKAERRYPWGSTSPDTQLCWRRGEGAQRGTCPVGSAPSSNTPEGLVDMAGNVWEWTTDPYCRYGGGSCKEGQRVTRGGSWASGAPEVITTTVRQEKFENDRGASIGFRCARTL